MNVVISLSYACATKKLNRGEGIKRRFFFNTNVTTESQSPVFNLSVATPVAKIFFRLLKN